MNILFTCSLVYCFSFPTDPAILKTLRSYQFTAVVAKHYDGSKTLRQGLWNTLFSWENFTRNHHKSWTANAYVPLFLKRKKARETPKKASVFSLRGTPKILGKERENTHTHTHPKSKIRKKSKEIEKWKKKGLEDQGRSRGFNTAGSFGFCRLIPNIGCSDLWHCVCAVLQITRCATTLNPKAGLGLQN